MNENFESFWKRGKDGKKGKLWKFEKSRNAFGTAHRPVADFCFAICLEHFVVADLGGGQGLF